MTPPIVLGVDPGFLYVGLAWIALLPDSERVIDLRTVASAAHPPPKAPRDPRKLASWERLTEPTRVTKLCTFQAARRAYLAAKKAAPSHSDDIARRARAIAHALRAALTEHGKVVAVCAETAPYLRDATATAKLALMFGVLIAECDRAGVPLYTTTPMRLKLAVTGDGLAPKPLVSRALITRYPLAATHLARVPEDQRAHPIDALGTTVACSSFLLPLRPQSRPVA